MDAKKFYIIENDKILPKNNKISPENSKFHVEMYLNLLFFCQNLM
jgi:hypothetical protein